MAGANDLSTFCKQVEELRAYFKGLGAEISAERSESGIEDDLHKIIGVCDACFKDANSNQIEEVLNGIVSMLGLVSFLQTLLLFNTFGL